MKQSTGLIGARASLLSWVLWSRRGCARAALIVIALIAVIGMPILQVWHEAEHHHHPVQQMRPDTYGPILVAGDDDEKNCPICQSFLHRQTTALIDDHPIALPVAVAIATRPLLVSAPAEPRTAAIHLARGPPDRF